MMKKTLLKPATGLALSLAFFGACSSNEEAAGADSGEKIAVNFTVSQQLFGAAETITSRSSALTENVIGEKLVPMGKNLYAHTKFVENMSTKMRATSVLANSKTLRIFAYTAGTTTDPVWTGDFKMSDGQLTRTSAVPALLIPDSYDFYAVSYNDETDPATWDLSEMKVREVDLMWCKTTQIVSENAANISLTLMHLFSEVSVTFLTTKLDAASQSLQKLEDVTISSSVSASLANVTDTTATSLKAIDEYYDEFNVSFPNLSSTSPAPPSVTSAPVRVFQGYDEAPAIFLKTGSITVGSTLFENLMLDFNKKMLPGHSYNLLIDFTYLYFADSNIYWDGTNLTFYEYGTAPSDTEKRMQGVFFKWGSLVGISPATTPELANDRSFYAGTTPIYVQTTPGVWAPTTAATAFGASGTMGPSAWISIPFVDTSYPGINYDRYSNYFFTSSHPYTLYKYDGEPYLGDICYHLTKNKSDKYRMPTSAEFDALNTSAFTAGSNYTDVDQYGNALANGQYPLAATFRQTGNVVLPASGYRAGYTYDVGYVGSYGFYWSSTMNETGYAYELGFNSGDVVSNNILGCQLATSVRCVTDKTPASIRINDFTEKMNSLGAGVVK